MNKKILSTILAGACALSCMSFAAFADEETGSYQTSEQVAAGTAEVTGDAAFTAPTISVKLPTKLAAVLNPYGVEIDLKATDAKGKTSKDGITSPIYAIENNTTDFGIIVKATATAVAKDPGDSSKTNKVKIATKEVTPKAGGDNEVYATLKAGIALTAAPKDTSTHIVFKDS